MKGIMMQYFEWYLPNDGTLWKKIAENAHSLATVGITALWLPPAYKGEAGIHDVGYGVYDMYDLGEFDQKGTIRTKYGTKDEYLMAIKALHKEGLQVYADVVLDHLMGADYTEQIQAYEENNKNRLQILGEHTIEAWTGFNYPGRNNKYSSFKWNHSHFDGVDYDERTKRSAVYNFVGTPWDTGVAAENANYDYLMGADICFSKPEVVEQLNIWGQWYLDFTQVDGFRLDAIKHIHNTFFLDWLTNLRNSSTRELFAVGEYWTPDTRELLRYLDISKQCLSLFDVPLHFNFYNACKQSGYFDMSKILDNTLMSIIPSHAVTFVENHDTQAGQALETCIESWFKPIAYAIILLRTQGYPCIFYGDYYGVKDKGAPSFRTILDLFCGLRQEKLYGTQHDYFDNPDIIGWTFEGDELHPNSGIAVLVDDGPGGVKNMYIGKSHAGQIFVDATKNLLDEILIDENGYGLFHVYGGSVSTWIQKI